MSCWTSAASPVRQHALRSRSHPSAECSIACEITSTITAHLTFTLAATDYALRAVVVPFIAALKVQAPGIRVRVVPVEPERLVAQLEQGKIDLALMTPHTTPDELHSRARHVGLSVSSFLVLPDVLAISDLIAVVPERMAENRAGMFVCDTPVAVQGFTKNMAWHGRTHRNPAQAWLRGLLLETSQRA